MYKNQALVSATEGILGQQMPCTARIAIEFAGSAAGSTFSFVPISIDNVVFDFHYTENVFTTIYAKIKVSGKDYALLQDQSQNLIASVRITPASSSGTPVRTVDPYLEKFRVLLVNPMDARIMMQDIHLHVEPTREMVVQLIEPLAYRLRHESVTACIHSATVSDMIHYLVHCHDIKNTDIIDPDNTHPFDHMIVPMYPSFMSSIGYLQSTYGVYAKGCSYYIQDDRLYVYPPFETNPSSQGTLTFFQHRVGQASLGGSKYTKAGNDFRIVIDKPAQATDMSLAGAENHGTGFSFTRASRTTGGMTYIDKNKEGSFTDMNTIIMSTNSPQTLDPSSNKIKQVRSTDNPYPHMSTIAAHQASLMTVEWDGVDITAFTPGKKVKYCYDENGVMAQRSGILQRAQVNFQQNMRADSGVVFSTHAQLDIRLATATRRVITGT